MWRLIKQIWPLLPCSSYFLCQFLQSSGTVVIQKHSVWKVPHLFGFLSIQCLTGCLARVWYDQHYWKWRQVIILARMNCTFPVETQKQYELAEGRSAGFDSWEWHCRDPLLKSSVVPWQMLMFVFILFIEYLAVWWAKLAFVTKSWAWFI